MWLNQGMKNLAKHWLSIAGIAALLTGCSAGETGAGQVKETTAATTTPATSAPASDSTREKQVEAVFLKIVRDGNAGLDSAADADLVELAKSICELYKGGASGADVNDSLSKGAGVTYTLKELVSINGSGVAAFCPEYTDRL